MRKWARPKKTAILWYQRNTKVWSLECATLEPTHRQLQRISGDDISSNDKSSWSKLQKQGLVIQEVFQHEKGRLTMKKHCQKLICTTPGLKSDPRQGIPIFLVLRFRLKKCLVRLVRALQGSVFAVMFEHASGTSRRRQRSWAASTKASEVSSRTKELGSVVTLYYRTCESCVWYNLRDVKLVFQKRAQPAVMTLRTNRHSTGSTTVESDGLTQTQDNPKRPWETKRMEAKHQGFGSCYAFWKKNEILTYHRQLAHVQQEQRASEPARLRGAAGLSQKQRRQSPSGKAETSWGWSWCKKRGKKKVSPSIHQNSVFWKFKVCIPHISQAVASHLVHGCVCQRAEIGSDHQMCTCLPRHEKRKPTAERKNDNLSMGHSTGKSLMEWQLSLHIRSKKSSPRANWRHFGTQRLQAAFAFQSWVGTESDMSMSVTFCETLQLMQETRSVRSK